jgi:hypothetical protein
MIENQCPNERRVSNRRKKLKKKWTGKIWQEKRLEFIRIKGGHCEWCGSTEYLTVHHPSRNEYGTDAYMDFYLSGCILLCRRCHQATHVGRTLCQNEHQDNENHYKWHDAEMCSYCFLKLHPEIKERQKAEKAALAKKKRDYDKQQRAKAKKWKADHPQKKNGVP